MSGSSQEAEDAWVRNTLGIAPISAKTSNDDAPPTGLVAYRKATLDLRSAIATVNSQLSTFAGRVGDMLPEEAALADRVAEAVNTRCEALLDRIDTGIGTPTGERSAENQKIQQAVLKLMAQVRSDQLIAHVDANPLAPLTVAATLASALSRVADSIV